ncbi:MAG TPA: sugar transferase [Chitinophagales bacterium]|nr:sugar transferase [Chitinophagales bacterium]
MRADVWYIENWSFTLDIKIVFMTIVNLIRGEENAF